jgi:hypothetical protein
MKILFTNVILFVLVIDVCSTLVTLVACAYLIGKIETSIHDNIRELVTWECKEHGVKS